MCLEIDLDLGEALPITAMPPLSTSYPRTMPRASISQALDPIQSRLGALHPTNLSPLVLYPRTFFCHDTPPMAPQKTLALAAKKQGRKEGGDAAVRGCCIVPLALLPVWLCDGGQ